MNYVVRNCAIKGNVLAFFLLFGPLVFCAAAGISEDVKKGNEKAQLSYSFGMVIASDLIETGLEFNYDAFVRGFRETMEGGKTLFTMDEAFDKVDEAFLRIQEQMGEKRRLEGEINLAEGNAFLKENSLRPGINVTPSGLQYEILSEGTGEIPGPADVVLVHYTGATIDGTVFDSSYDRGEPLQVPLDMVIPGWAEGLRMMREGGKTRLYIPPNLAYGANGAGDMIAPNAVLVFDVEFISIIVSHGEEEAPDDFDGGFNDSF